MATATTADDASVGERVPTRPGRGKKRLIIGERGSAEETTASLSETTASLSEVEVEEGDGREEEEAEEEAEEEGEEEVKREGDGEGGTFNSATAVELEAMADGGVEGRPA